MSGFTRKFMIRFTITIGLSWTRCIVGYRTSSLVAYVTSTFDGLHLHPTPPLTYIKQGRNIPSALTQGQEGFRLPELTDDDISDLLEEPKALPIDYVKHMKPVKKSRMQYSQAELAVQGERGSEFKVIIIR